MKNQKGTGMQDARRHEQNNGASRATEQGVEQTERQRPGGTWNTIKARIKNFTLLRKFGPDHESSQ